MEWSACGSERIPLDLIDEAQAERSLFKNLELQSQILYSVSDQVCLCLHRVHAY